MIIFINNNRLILNNNYNDSSTIGLIRKMVDSEPTFVRIPPVNVRKYNISVRVRI